MERCWAEDEHARPTFEEVLAKLDDLRTCESGHARLRGGESHRWACTTATLSRTLQLLHGLWAQPQFPHGGSPAGCSESHAAVHLVPVGQGGGGCTLLLERSC
jgi:hypothetical protein